MKLSTAPAASGGRAPRGRVNQKRRTRQALIEAALALSEAGHRPSLQEVAEKALVSRATAYRYFPSVEGLVHEAYLERVVASLERTVIAGESPAEAAGRAAADINGLLLQDEIGLHVIERSFMQVWLDNAADARPPRAGRRMKFIDPIVAALAATLDSVARERLRTALSMVIGVEAVLSMRDVAGASAEHAIAAGNWAAKALVAQALSEAEARPRPPRRPRSTKSRRDRR